ncbi:hypothetical protein ACFLYW_00290 [Thermodesulfobacteriota bacterium]
MNFNPGVYSCPGDLAEKKTANGVRYEAQKFHHPEPGPARGGRSFCSLLSRT